MTSHDFFLVCSGISVVLVSCAWAIKLLRRPGRPMSTSEDVPKARSGLHGRLEDFQEQRFAPLRVPTPGEPGAPRVVPPIRALRPGHFSIPRQPPAIKKKPKSNVVVQLPVKAPKDDDDKKE